MSVTPFDGKRKSKDGAERKKRHSLRETGDFFLSSLEGSTYKILRGSSPATLGVAPQHDMCVLCQHDMCVFYVDAKISP